MLSNYTNDAIAQRFKLGGKTGKVDCILSGKEETSCNPIEVFKNYEVD